MSNTFTRHQDRMGRQKGMTLIEMMVAMVISLVVSTAMIMLMANTLGVNARTIGMTRLTQELRISMQIISRDLRRANYISPVDARTCFANVDCLDDLGYGSNIGTIVIGPDTNADGFGECLSYWLDRDLSSSFDATEIGAFRLSESDGIGRIEMMIESDSTVQPLPGVCPSGTWVAITNPDTIDVQSFQVDDSDTYTETISASGSTQTVQNIRLLISADLRNSGTLGFTISREIGDQIQIRNNFTTI